MNPAVANRIEASIREQFGQVNQDNKLIINRLVKKINDQAVGEALNSRLSHVNQEEDDLRELQMQ